MDSTSRQLVHLVWGQIVAPPDAKLSVCSI